VYAWSWRQPLPSIPIPLAADDHDTVLDLQAAFSRVYEDFRYDHALDYRRPVRPRLSETDAEWVRTLLTGARSASEGG
jgi:hypothetical protein